MKVSIFTTSTRPNERGDNYIEACECYNDFADEVIDVNGDISWPQEFDWPLIGQHFQRGYEGCSGDWVIHMDLDFIFHQKDFGKIRQALRDYPNAPAISFYKWQFILPDRYNLKSRLLLAVNKKAFGDRITFSGGGDMCQPQLDGVDINIDEMPQAGVPFYNYEKLSKTKDQIKDDVERMDRAYKQHFGEWLYSKDGRNAYKGWLHMAKGRFQKPQEFIKLGDHPKYIQDTIYNLRPDQWGFSGLGELEVNRYAQSSMLGR